MFVSNFILLLLLSLLLLIFFIKYITAKPVLELQSWGSTTANFKWQDSAAAYYQFRVGSNNSLEETFIGPGINII